MTATIRPRTDDDLAALAKVLVEVHDVDGYPVEGVKQPIAWLELPDAIAIWIAQIDGKPVGHVAITEPGAADDAARLLREQPAEGHTAILGRLFVSPSARGQGIAQQLVLTAMTASARMGRRLVLDVMKKDEAAIRLYRRLGWTEIGSVEHKHVAGPPEPALAMAAPEAINNA